MVDRGPISTCLSKHKRNDTLDYHECMCNFDYSFAKSRYKALKIKHCLEAAEMNKITNFYTYVVVAALIIVGTVACIAGICSFKWYWETKDNPCNCCSFSCFCKRKNKRKSKDTAEHGAYDQTDNGHTWSPVSLPPNREDVIDGIQKSEENLSNSNVCMDFCLSDPVQDCCEFFDCDIMWRKKSVYTIPIFGRKKQQHFQRRPTRPAPLPPKAVVLPQIKNDAVYDADECEPVPEAPPSPEPVRTLPAKAMYVDPITFLQQTFNKNVKKEQADENDGKQEPLYSKFKNMVMSKMKKSPSVASVNNLETSDCISSNPSGMGPSGKKKTASMASLHNLSDSDLDNSYGSKRSLSLASLHMLQDPSAFEAVLAMEQKAALDPRSRISMLSNTSSAADDIPPAARIDEYIDLEEMSKRIEARRLAARSLGASPTPQQSFQAPQPLPSSSTSAYTPNFIPASAFVAVTHAPANTIPQLHYQSHQTAKVDVTDASVPPNYYPPIPASQGRPAIPARTIGPPVYSMSPSGTLGRPKPALPPRPHLRKRSDTEASSSPSNSRPQSPRVVKPKGPPPPPPSSGPGCKFQPIESSI